MIIDNPGVFLFFVLAELQKKVQKVYQGPVMTTLIVIVIVSSFVTAAILWEMEDNDQGEVAEAYAGLTISFISDLELAFVVIFTVELSLAFFAEFPQV